jgi:hypothetical protein
MRSSLPAIGAQVFAKSANKNNLLQVILNPIFESAIRRLGELGALRAH